MTSLSSYTPLESLLLFQALQADGVTSIPFTKISEQLHGVPLVRNDPTFDSARLKPAALRDLYLGLLKEEARNDLENGQHGFASPNSKKRRAPTPSLPTVEEAAKHSHLIPKLIHRLYARYRDKMMDEIRAEERRYDALSQEIRDIESGKWDEKLRKEQADHTPQQLPVQPAQPVQPVAHNTHPSHRPILPAPDHDRLRKSATASPAPQSNNHATEAKEVPSGRPNHAKIDAVINHEPSTLRASASPRLPKAPVTTALPPLSEMAPESPGPYQPPSRHSHTPQLPQPPPLQPGPAYRASPPVGHHAPLPAPYPLPSSQGPSPSPKLQNALGRASPSSPRPVLPLPPGMKMPSQSPIPPNGVSAHRPAPIQPHPPHQYAQQPQRLPPMPLHPTDRNTPRTVPPHLQTPGYPQPYPQYQGAPQPYPQPAPPPHQQQPQPSYAARPQHQVPPHHGGVQLPPFQVGPQEPSRSQPPHMAHHAPTQPLRPQPVAPTPPTFSSYPSYNQTSQPPLPMQDQARLVSSIIETLRRTPWATWKAARPAHLPQPQSEESPSIEPLSPAQESAPSLPPHVAARANNAPQDVKPAPQDQGIQPVSSKPAKSVRKHTRPSRAGSTASSAVAGSVRARTRSQSVVSHAESQPAQFEASATLRQVKDEPTTPADFVHHEDILAAPAETPTTSKGIRPRRGTLQAQAQIQTQSAGKRKRPRSPSPITGETEAVPTYLAPRNDFVLASRNFQRLSAVIMNDITTHRHAGPFQKPVREKDAEGYSDIIKRPQDLKSIKAAITAGTRAIGTATAKDTSTDSPSATPSGNTNKDGVTVALEKTADLMPPRAIVNSSQLEKEVMRMFANAVMFNPGEGGMVQDAREMADDIEAKVRDWRSAERQVEGRDDDDDSTAAGAGPGKRRKL